MPPQTTGPKKSQLAGCLQSCLAVFVLLAAVGGYYWWDAVKRDKEHDADVAKAKQFERLTSAKAPPANAIDDSQARYRKGHLLLIDARQGKLDDLNQGLPASLRAVSPDDVGTEVWLNWDETLVGHYDNNDDAYKTNCDLTVYDVARNAVVAREHIEGDDPDKTISTRTTGGTGIHRSKVPVDKIMKFLQDLPAR